ncbi:MAG TPA: UTP--glucose-1-phosphate uridylyltransferase GalU [Methylococcaceae bacterium]|jgi:UTP--glucose-1-phosphate uridylyltransferase|nr:UTP--glucose-1-phosphate uridylyltransferase GalU [Methylococcaceae bacterium]HIA46064.1 UTP--glucose-1-phosphate uridylyltransferase GalU [Methylococcaceae bacterium]HIB62156.1 UTP--glucose-1-phosphate uridylyltransferase GalU [Methylococcaceae bacterium]HIN69109.1 UTP--glucose-1-phosphate uridylyltransferase GalU [Methylococcales bacterium]HIO44224.1 UTP--glucose-1-phosphate uridylyltransferase GalU [Methylococcales bacterium]
MKNKITKAVFPVAGLGTRFLPVTKASPKEMLPIVDKPLIQYAVEEAVAAGIDTMIFITGRNKRSIDDHFDKAYELERELTDKGKVDALAELKRILPDHVSYIFIRQAEALGLGHAVQCAASVIGDEPFAVILPDDLIADGTRGCLLQMVEKFSQQRNSIIGVERVAPEDTSSYGIVEVGQAVAGVSAIEHIVEKPLPEDAPSNLAVVGRYLFTPAIFEKLSGLGKGAGGEIQLTDAIALLLNDEPVCAYEFEGKRYDCGSKLGFLIANVEYGLAHPELKIAFEAYLNNR